MNEKLTNFTELTFLYHQYVDFNMKLNSKLKMRSIAGETIVLLQSNGTNDMTKVLALNTTSKFLWENLSGKDFELDDVVDLLTGQYEVGRERAQADAEAWVKQLKELSVIESQ